MIGLSFLDTYTPQQIKALPPEDLALLVKALEDELACLKQRKQVLEDGLRLKYFEAAQAALRATHRDTGRVKIYDRSCVIVAELPKRVVWDQEKLVPLVASLSPEKRPPTLKTTYTIHEHIYKAWPLAYQDLFKPARTVHIGTPSFTFEAGDIT